MIKSKPSYIFIVFLFIYNLLSAQSLLEWERFYGGSEPDFARSVIQTMDGSFIVLGTTASPDGDVQNFKGKGVENIGDIWLMKINTSGVVSWKKTLGGSLDDDSYDMIESNDGHLIICGRTYSSNFDVQSGNKGNVDAWVIKVNINDGSIIWEKTYGGSSTDIAHRIEQTVDGGYIIAGSSMSNNGDVKNGNKGAHDAWIIKVDNTGKIEWEKTYGGSDGDVPRAIIECNDGGYIFVCNTRSSASGDISGINKGVGYSDLWIVKIDSSKNIIWEKNYGGMYDELPNNMFEDSDGNYIVFASARSNDGDVIASHGGMDWWILKIDQVNGNILWQKTIGGSGGDWLPYLNRGVRKLCINGKTKYLASGLSDSPISGDKTKKNSLPSGMSPGSGLSSPWVLLLDENVNIVWDQVIDSVSFSGSYAYGYANYSYPTFDGGFIFFANPQQSSAKKMEWWVRKYKDDDLTNNVVDTDLINGNLITICDDSFAIVSCMYDYDKYWWSNNIASKADTLYNQGLYLLKVRDDKGCYFKDSVYLLAIDCDTIEDINDSTVIGTDTVPEIDTINKYVFIPNVITPNNDGINDVFQINVSASVSDINFKLYNTKGKLIYETTDPSFYLDANSESFSNSNSEMNVFVYHLMIQFSDGYSYLLNGNLTLLK